MARSRSSAVSARRIAVRAPRGGSAPCVGASAGPRLLSESCTNARNRSSERLVPVSPHSSMVRSRCRHVHAHGSLGMPAAGAAPAPALEQHRIARQAALQLGLGREAGNRGARRLAGRAVSVSLLGGPACIAAAEHHPHAAIAVRGLEVRAILVHARAGRPRAQVQVGRTRAPDALSVSAWRAMLLHGVAIPAPVGGAGRLERVVGRRPDRAGRRGRAGGRARRDAPPKNSTHHEDGAAIDDRDRRSVRIDERAATWRPAESRTGGDLLSRALAGQVPSARRGLTALFGMGRGVSPSLVPPKMARGGS